MGSLWTLLRHMVYIIFTMATSNQSNDSPMLHALSDIKNEVIDGAVTIDYGTIPKWLNGNFIRHGCGAFGNVNHQDPDLPNYVSHLFDCIVMGTKFRLENGQVTFTNRWYDVTTMDIYNQYGQDMNRSSVFTPTAFSKTNARQVQKYAKQMGDPSKVGKMPAVSWWKVGSKAMAMTEMPIGVVVDPGTVQQGGYIRYMDDNLGYGRGVTFTNNPAHQHEEDGIVWSVVSAVDMSTMPNMKIWRAVYKVGADKVRHVVGEYHYSDADVTKCSQVPPTSRYPDIDSRFGYMHSFAFTEHYVILPETGYMFDPCFYPRYDQAKPYFQQGYSFEETGYSRLLVMRKSDGVFVADIKTKPFFTTHQLGSYEDGDFIHVDMLFYNNADIYTKYTFLDSMLNEEETYLTEVVRITIDTRDWSVTFNNLRKGKPEAFEMPVINFAYNGKKYTYSYMAKNFMSSKQNAITKLNVDTGEETEYLYDEGQFSQEPQFVARPNSTSEDDGVILVQGVDGNKQKGFLTVLDAKTMTLMAHVTATGNALFGLHGRFFELDDGQ